MGRGKKDRDNPRPFNSASPQNCPAQKKRHRTSETVTEKTKRKGLHENTRTAYPHNETRKTDHTKSGGKSTAQKREMGATPERVTQKMTRLFMVGGSCHDRKKDRSTCLGETSKEGCVEDKKNTNFVRSGYTVDKC